MHLYLIVYEIDNVTDWLTIAHESYLSTDDAYKLALEQAIANWGNDEPDSYTADDIEELSCESLDKIGTYNGKRQFAVNLTELEA